MCSNNEEKELGPKVGLNGDKRKSFEKVKSCQVKFLEGILTILIETFHFVHQHFFSRYFALFRYCCEKRETRTFFLPPSFILVQILLSSKTWIRKYGNFVDSCPRQIFFVFSSYYERKIKSVPA